jgi:hypothetical protein
VQNCTLITLAILWLCTGCEAAAAKSTDHDAEPQMHYSNCGSWGAGDIRVLGTLSPVVTTDPNFLQRMH